MRTSRLLVSLAVPLLSLVVAHGAVGADGAEARSKVDASKVAPSKPQPPRDLSGMGWIAGTWSGAMWGGTFVAYYTTPEGGKVLSTSRLLVDDVERFYEFEVFEPDGEGVVLRPYPRGQAADTLSLVSLDPEARRAVFENPDKDYPTRIVYERTTDEDLVITLTDPHNESEKTEVFRLKR